MRVTVRAAQRLQAACRGHKGRRIALQERAYNGKMTAMLEAEEEEEGDANVDNAAETGTDDAAPLDSPAQALEEAYDVLVDPAARLRYDQEVEDAETFGGSL